MSSLPLTANSTAVSSKSKSTGSQSNSDRTGMDEHSQHPVNTAALRLRHSQVMGLAPASGLSEVFSCTNQKASLKRICCHCSNQVSMDQPPLPQCSRCHVTPYCGQACQRAAWKVHKKFCVDLKDVMHSSKSPAHQRCHDERQLPTLGDIAQVLGPSYDLRKLPYIPPIHCVVTMDRAEYDSRVKKATESVFSYAHLQEVEQKKASAAALRTMAINSMDSSEYREARTIALLVELSPLKALCPKRYEMWTEEYVTHFAQYLKKRVLELQSSQTPQAGQSSKVTDSSTSSIADCVASSSAIVEIGAGNGMLSFHLNAKLQAMEKDASNVSSSSSSGSSNQFQSSPVRVLATDNNSWFLGRNMYSYGSKAPSADSVMQLDAQSALKRLSPKIVIVSWMPMYHDWTAAIRACPSVQEYILIGPAFTGQIGHLFDTWGALPDSSKPELTAASHVTPYQREGFSRHHLHEVSQYQICEADLPSEMFASATIAFRRNTTSI